MHDARLVVWNAFIEALVKREQMAGGASVREFHWRHQFAPVHGLWGAQCSGMQGQNFVALIVAGGRGAILRIGVRQIRIGGSCVMAVTTFEIDDWTGGPSANGFQMDRVIEFDRAGIACGDCGHRAQRGEFRMVVFEAENVILVLGVGTFGVKIAMARRTRLVAGGGKIDAAAVLGVTRGAIR